MAALLDLTIINRGGVVLNTKANAVTSFNSKGKFDILPSHSNFISLIEKAVLYYDEVNKPHEYKLEKALMKVASNQVKIYLSI